MSITQIVKEHEEVGAAMYHLSRPAAACRSVAMRRGWEQARRDAENESFGSATIETALEAQMARNRAVLRANATILSGGR